MRDVVRQVVEEPPVRAGGGSRYRQCDICGYGESTVTDRQLAATWHVCRRGPDDKLWMIMWGRA